MDNEEIQGVKFSEFPSATPENADEVVGLHAGDNARFSLANLMLAVRQGLVNLFVPLTRTINGKALSSNITLDASDVGAVDTDAVGVADGVASLDSNGKVPGTQLDLSGKQSTITANGILKGDGQGGVSAATPGTDYATPTQMGVVTLGTSWSGAGPYYQTVTVTGATITANSKVNLQFTPNQIASLIADGVLAILVENNNGTLTVYAIGASPASSMTVQCTVEETI